MELGVAVLVAFFALFVVGFPVVFAILIPSLAYIWWEGIPLATIGQRVLYALDSFPLVAVPVFIFVGNLMNAGGITDRIYHFSNTLAGRLPGGLAQVNIVGSLIFSGVSGAALADVGGIGKIEIKAMKDEGFPVPFAAALTGASAIVGPIFPPSIPIIIYASVTSISALQLLVAGIIPALRLRRDADDRDRHRQHHARTIRAPKRWPTAQGAVGSRSAGRARLADAGCAGRRHAVGHLHADRSFGGLRRLYLPYRRRLLSRDELGLHPAGGGRHRPHLGGRADHRRRRRDVRLDPGGRAGAAVLRRSGSRASRPIR